MRTNHFSSSPGCARLWYMILSPQEVKSLEHISRQVLAAEELRRAEVITAPWRRRHFLAGRVLLRQTLARCLRVEPHDLVFQTAEHSRPVLKTPSDSHLHFSLSHSGRMVVCAVAPGCPIGVDVEAAHGFKTPMEVAERFFAPAEVETLLRLQGRQRRTAFLTLWTLKEAFAKAQGQGLHATGLKASFLWYLDSQAWKSDIRTVSAHSLMGWQFATLGLLYGYHTALAVYSSNELPVRVHSVHSVQAVRS